jgi:AcrR family transcriptional regulator
MFAEKGWAATGMRDIAREAGVATETVYSHFSSKTGLLKRVIDIAVVGDDASVPMAERPEFAAIGQGSRAKRIAQAAHVTAEVHRRTGRFARVLREAAPSDESIAEMLRSTRERQRLDIAAGAELLLGRPPTALELDGLWATLSPEVYLLLVEDSGWAVEQYQAWVAQTLECQVSKS